MHIKALFAILVTLLAGRLYAQQTQIYDSHIQTVRTIVNDDYRLPAVIELNSSDRIELSFDQLSHEYHRYQYVLQHCNSDWTLSDLSEIDYLDGFNNNIIENCTSSINTTMEYTHYSLRLPNNQVKLRLSGNYILTIFDDEDLNTPILKTSFRVLEKQVSVSASVSSDTEIDRNKTHQQVSVNVNYRGYNIRNPQQEVKVQVLQNRRTDNMVTVNVPTFISNSELQYTHNRALIFDAGNEYRRFEMVDFHYAGEGVEKIRLNAPYYHATLYTGEPRRNYSYDQDQDGRYVIRYTNATDNSIEADYFFVHFSLASSQLNGGKLYLAGDLTNNAFNELTEMKYNELTRNYETVQLLKEGAYNYMYFYVPNNKTVGQTGPVEGNFYEAENEYYIYVYYRPFGERYDRLVGMQEVKFKP